MHVAESWLEIVSKAAAVEWERLWTVVNAERLAAKADPDWESPDSFVAAQQPEVSVVEIERVFAAAADGDVAAAEADSGKWELAAARAAFAAIVAAVVVQLAVVVENRWPAEEYTV